MPKGKRRTFSKEFKLDVVSKKLNNIYRTKEICEKYDVDRQTLCRWVNEYKKGGEAAFDSKSVLDGDEVRQLKERLKQSEMENEILEKSRSVLCATQADKIDYAINFLNEYPVSKVCEVLKISRSSYYYRKNNPLKGAYTKEEMQPVIDIFYEHHGSFGRRTLKVLLERKGISFSEWKISRIMKINGLRSKYQIKKAKNVYTSSNTEKYIRDNIYATLTDEEKKKEIWSTDFTEEKVEGKTVYTCGIKSINSKAMVGFRMSTKMTSKLAIETLLDAIQSYGIPDMILTDRGSQFASKAYHDILKKYGIMHSMSRPHYAVDNCFIETFWKTIKTEIGSVKNYTVEQYAMVMSYFWNYYNYKRPHSSLNYESPITINL